MVEAAIRVDGYPGGLGHHDLARAELGQAVRGLPQIILPGQQFCLSPIGLEIGHVSQSFRHIEPRTKDQVTPLPNADESLHINGYRPSAR